jgi:hypothetical protein
MEGDEIEPSSSSLASLQTPLLADDHHGGTTEELILLAGDHEEEDDANDDENRPAQHPSSSSSSFEPQARRGTSWNYYLHCTLLPDRPWAASHTDSNEESLVADNDDSNNGNDTNGQDVNGDDNDTSRQDDDDEDDDDDDDDDDNIDLPSATVKLLKFLALTFLGIFGLHWMVSHRTNHRDLYLRVWHLWVFQGNLIVRDTIVFFWVGRLWRRQQRGVDHLSWILVVVLSNVYLESQHYVSFLRHSATLFEIHCVWTWQLWVFVVLGILPVVIAVAVAHVIRAVREQRLGIQLAEIALSAAFFLAPVVSSPYFHFHHWFAGWLIGMHCNVDVWWSRAAMAWCWGMYINGIAVYGRDPVLMCEYAEFLTKDQRCPFATSCDVSSSFPNSSSVVEGWSGLVEGWSGLVSPLYADDDMPPPAVDWRNCSSNGYHP